MTDTLHRSRHHMPMAGKLLVQINDDNGYELRATLSDFVLHGGDAIFEPSFGFQASHPFGDDVQDALMQNGVPVNAPPVYNALVWLEDFRVRCEGEGPRLLPEAVWLALEAEFRRQREIAKATRMDDTATEHGREFVALRDQVAEWKARQQANTSAARGGG